MAMIPGTTLGAYEILGALGAGGMGEVFRARGTKLRREVAVKILRRDGAAAIVLKLAESQPVRPTRRSAWCSTGSRN
jgi:serine/threonine protein kinase